MSEPSAVAPTRLVSAFRGPSSEARFRRWLLLVTLGGLALRIAYVYLDKRWDRIGGDGGYYQGAAQLLADGKGFIHPLALLTGRTLEAADHPPLYILWLFVPEFLGVSSRESLLLWSCVLGSGTVAVLGLVGRRVGGDRVGLIAAVLAAVYPPIWSQDGTLQSETMAILWVSLVLLAAYRYWDRPGLGRAVVLGLAIGLAAMSRSELLLLGPLVALPLALWSRSVPMARRLQQVTAAGLACIVAVAPWCIYNLTRFENRVLLSTGAEITLLTSNCDTTYYGEKIGYWSLDCGRDIDVTPDLDQSEAAVLYRREAVDYIKEHKGRVPLVVAARWARIANLWDPATQVRLERTIEQRPAWLAWGSIVSFWAAALLAIAGGVVLRRRRVPVIPLLAPVAVVLWAITVTHAESRYRASCEGALVVLAAVALDAGLRRWRDRRAPASATAAGDDGRGSPAEAAPPGVPVGAP
jgi:4-amino-4-deoxy-L-arabinose transferase-like glycosyltransferase